MKAAFTFIILIIIVSISFADDTNDYIKKYRKIAIKEMKKYGVPASITLAQGILESGSGKSRLAIKGRNHFGIKCTNDWHGKTIHEDDDRKDECFRKYKKAEQSFRDHSEFIANRQRYQFLLDYKKTDYVAWANGLKKAGYATNPNYPNLLINLIEKYDLSIYDKKAGKQKIKREKKFEKENIQKTETQFHTVKKGDTLFSISKKYQISIDELKLKNKKTNNELFLGEKLIIH